MRVRCEWANSSHLMQLYHDTEWGNPSFDDGYLFEMLMLEGMQAGLSWQIILNRRESMREAFDQFDWRKIALYSDDTLEKLCKDERVIRHRLKIYALRQNAAAFETVRQEFGSFATYIWGFVSGKTIQNHYQHVKELPVSTELSEIISKDLKKRGFKFVGSTIVYSYLQAIGIVNDHVGNCEYKNKMR